MKKKIITFINKKLSKPYSYPFIMHKDEKLLLKKYLRNSKFHLEFGIGGSTIFSLIESNAQIFAVDSDKKWIDFMTSYKIIKKNLQKRLFVYYENIGATKSWGFPIDNENKALFSNFSKNIFNKIESNKITSVLVDGRFRVACTLQTLLNCTNKNLVIIIHDYSLRDEYKIVENFLIPIENTNTLYVFKSKENIDFDELKKCYELYKNIPN